MSVRLIVAAVAGVAVGYVTGNYQAGFQTFAAVYGVTGGLDPATKVQGPRLDDLKVASGSYGAPVAYIEGHPRVPGNIIWCTDKREIANESSQGGKGGPGVDTTLYTYEVDLIVMLAENSGVGVRRVWSNGALVWSAADDADDETLDASAAANSWREIRFCDGNASQLPDPTYEAAVGVGNAPAYRDRSTVVIVGLNLGGSGQFPVLTFETYTLGTVTDSTGFREDFSEGLTPYLLTGGDPAVFELGGGYDGAGLKVVGGPLTAASSSITRTVSATAFTAARLRFRLDEFDSAGVEDDAPTVAAFHSGVIQFGFSAAREKAFDPGQRACVILNDGGASPHFVSDAALIIGTWYQIDLLILSSSQLQCVLSYAGGAAIKTTLIGGTFTTWSADALTFSDQNGPSGTKPTCSFDDIILGSPGLRVALEEVPLDEVVQRQWQRAGLDLAYLDVTQLEGIFVRAMAVSQVTSPRQVIETLGSAYLFECVESGAIVRMVLRGGAPVATLAFDDLGASTGDAVEAFPRTRGNELELPAQVSVKFANVDDDYQDGNESSTRLATGSVIVTNVEVPLGLTATEAKRLADVSVTDALASIIRFGPIGLTRKHAALEPTDVILIIGKDGSTYRSRILKRTDSGGVATIEGVLDDATAISSDAVTSGGYNSSTNVRQAPPTDDILLDIPILRDADNDQGFYWAAKPAGEATWKGAVLYQSRDDVSYEKVSDILDAAIFGACTTTLGDWTGYRQFDERNSVTVNIGTDTLSSSTRDDILNDQTINACAVGVDGRWELLQFRTATLLGTGVYKLTGLLRGSRGTEWAMTAHSSAERFVLLRAQGIRRVLVDVSALGSSRYYKDVSVGRNLAATVGETFTDTGVGVKPMSPFDVRASRNPSTHDITLTWQRRTRLAVRTTGPLGVSIPLGEQTEAYSVDVFTDGTYVTVKRTLAATSASVAYTSAQQVSDFGSNQSTVYVKVYQLSAVIGRGYPVQAAA